MIKSFRKTELFIVLFLALTLFSCKNKSTLPDPLEAGWNGKAVCELVEDNLELRVIKCTFAPGVGHEKHYHNPHFGYTLVGGKFKITDTIGTRKVDIPTGYSFSNAKVNYHEVLNIGETTAVFLIMEYK